MANTNPFVICPQAIKMRSSYGQKNNKAEINAWMRENTIKIRILNVSVDNAFRHRPCCSKQSWPFKNTFPFCTRTESRSVRQRRRKPLTRKPLLTATSFELPSCSIVPPTMQFEIDCVCRVEFPACSIVPPTLQSEIDCRFDSQQRITASKQTETVTNKTTHSRKFIFLFFKKA